MRVFIQAKNGIPTDQDHFNAYIGFREMGFEIKVEPQGAFYIFADARKFTTDSYRFAFDVLEHAHVGITPGVDFGTGGEGYVRFSYANSLENIKEGLDRINRYLSRLGF